MSGLETLTAAALSAGYAAGRFSPVDVTAAALRRVEAVNPQLNALYTVDGDRAMAAARAAEARWAKGVPLSALDGVPTTIKDALPSVGDPSFRGSAAYAGDDPVSQTDAPCVARMREAGMVFLGKTTMPDFGILASGLSSKHGVARNPWRLDRTPGGSSAGAAASVAAGLAPVVVGTDIVGSIRLPASFTGLFGFKPSQGRVPYYVPNSPSLVAGPMARTVQDAALLMNVISQADSRDYTALDPDGTDYTACLRPPEGATIAVVTELGFGVQTEGEVVDAVTRAAGLLERAGHRLVWRDAGFTAEDLRAAELFYKVRCRAEFLMAPAERQRQAAVIADWSAEADSLSATDFYRLFNAMERLRERAARLIDGCDFLVLPAVPTVAFPAEQPGYAPDALFAPWANTFLFNLTGQPASSVPCAVSRDGLPIGLQIVGRRFADASVFALSAACEALLPQQDAMDAMIRRLAP